MDRAARMQELGLWPAWRLRPAASVAPAPSPADPSCLRQGTHTRGYLPHLKAEGGIYFVTFRLADSLPATVLKQLAELPSDTRGERIDQALDRGLGDCWLTRPEVAAVVRDALREEAMRRCRLHGWVLMPNHVHALIEPTGEAALSDVLQSIKSVSAHRANQLLGRDGEFWQRESYDHLIRDQADFDRHLEYIHMNPVRAGLVAEAGGYRWSSACLAGEGACATGSESPGAGVAQAPSPASGAGAAPVAGMDWDELRAAVKACTRCGLHQTRTQGVPGVGDIHADWLVIGEAPGADEDRLGEPFVGQAGRLLDAMLAGIGLARGRNVYIANILKSRPPGNRDPRPEEVAACLPFLERQIELIGPKLILVLGRIAAQTLLVTDTPIGKLRGQVHEYRGVPMVVTYHPAYLLRNGADKAKAWDDLVLARQTMARLTGTGVDGAPQDGHAL